MPTVFNGHHKWSVEALRPRNERIQPEVKESWVESGRYDTLEQAETWANQLLKTTVGILAVRLRHHVWSSEIVWEKKI